MKQTCNTLQCLLRAYHLHLVYDEDVGGGDEGEAQQGELLHQVEGEVHQDGGLHRPGPGQPGL